MLVVFGSINMDMVVQPDHLPKPGETVLCPDYQLFPGGKGANQALAAARIGVRVALVGCVGGDAYARQVLDTIRRQGVMTSGVAQSDRPTGCAMVFRERGGRNLRIVASGANNDTTSDQVPDEILREGNMILVQTEVPDAEVFDLIRRAHAHGVRVILNLAPVVPLPDDILPMVSVLVVNDIEVDQVASNLGLGEIEHADMAREIATRGKTICIATLAENGVLVANPDGSSFTVNALPVEVVDTTGAGDAFCGTLAAYLYNGMDLADAVRHAAIAGSLACTKEGSIDAFAYQDDIESRLDAVRIG